MSRILIHGVNTLLGSHCAARWIHFQGSTLLYADNVGKESAIQWIANAVRQIESGAQAIRTPAQVADLLQPAGEDSSTTRAGALASISEIWFFDDGSTSQIDLEVFVKLLSVYPDTLPPFLNYVQTELYSADGPGVRKESRKYSSVTRAKFTQQLENICSTRNIRMCLVETPLITGNLASGLVSRDVVPDFLSVLHAFKAEIEERSPQYFDFHALRYFAPEDAAMDMLTAAQASGVLLSKKPGMLGEKTRITSELKVPFATLCEHISTVFNLSFLPVNDLSTLNAIDRLFRERVYRIQSYLESPAEKQTEGFSIVSVPNLEFGEEAQLEFLESVRQNLDQAAIERKHRIASLPDQLTSKTIDRNGSELTYYLGGSRGPVVLLLNALGQSLEYWHRLIDSLINEYRVIIWEPRGTVAPPQPFGLADQVDDLQAVLDNENISSCHAVCWCTSPKVAIDFHLRRPSVLRSMTFLNSTFKCEGSPEDFDTPYEKNLFSLCRMLMRKPEMAASVMKTFQSRSEESELEVLETPDTEQMSIAVLSRMNNELKPYVLGPFKTEATTSNYARQMMDFWANDCRSKAAGIDVPVLLIGAEHDQIISPESSEFGATLFPNARHVHLSGATHYFLHDRAPMLAALLQKFFESPADLPAAQSKQEMVASAS